MDAICPCYMFVSVVIASVQMQWNFWRLGHDFDFVRKTVADWWSCFSEASQFPVAADWKV